MAKSKKLEETLALLAEIRDDPTSETGLTTLRQVLKSKYAIAVAQAAKLIGTVEIAELVPELETAFARFMSNPIATDPNCLAKKAIAQALYRLEYGNEALFLAGIHHVQLEPVWGGKDDTAAALRGVCALGLVRMNYPEVMTELADLLADPKPEARVAAVQAIAYTQNDQGVPLLRLRVHVGDETQVLSECLTALLKLAPTGSLPLIKNLLRQDDETALVAALALGESRLSEAFALLRDWWQQTHTPELRRTGLLAIAMLRDDTALDFLLSLVTEGKSQEAKDAIAALSLYRQDEALWRRVICAAKQRGESNLLESLQ